MFKINKNLLNATKEEVIDSFSSNDKDPIESMNNYLTVLGQRIIKHCQPLRLKSESKRLADLELYKEVYNKIYLVKYELENAV